MKRPQIIGVLHRREFLFSGGLLAYSLFLPSKEQVRAAECSELPVAPDQEFVDTNVYLFRWPFRRIRCDDTQGLVMALRARGVVQAWAGSFEALFHRDLSGVNQRLIEECNQHPHFFVPCPTVNPLDPDWRTDFRHCVEMAGCRILRLFPNYHGYALDAPEVIAFCQLAAKTGVLVQIVVEMEDERTQHPWIPVPPVDWQPLRNVLQHVPDLKVMLLNVHRRCPPAQLKELIKMGQVFTDLTMLEGMGCLERLLEYVPVERVCFGSFSPLFYFESATLKLAESVLAEVDLQAISHKNAAQILTAIGGSS